MTSKILSSRMFRNSMRALFAAFFFAAAIQVLSIKISNANDDKSGDEKKEHDVLSDAVHEGNAKDMAYEIERRRLAALEKEKVLEEYEKKIKQRETELDAKNKELEALRSAISAELGGQKQKSEERVAKMVTVLETMKPVASAGVLETTDDWLAVEVLKKMDTKKMAKIMNVMNKDRSARLSELMTGYAKQESNIQGHITSILKKDKGNRLPAGQATTSVSAASLSEKQSSAAVAESAKQPELAPSAPSVKADQGQVQKGASEPKKGG